MSLFNFFRREQPPRPLPAIPSAPPTLATPAPTGAAGTTAAAALDPSQLRELLFDAAARDDAPALAALCRAHRDAILRHLPEWKVVPEPLRKDRAAVRRYGNGLIRVAQTFQQEFGDDSILRSFQSAPCDDPLRRWQGKLAEAREMAEALRYDEAKELLANLLIDVRHLMSFGPTSLTGMTHGQLGACLFGKGEVAEALAHFERALGLCAEQGDEEGVRAYAGALYEVHRYLGRWGEAADYAEQRAHHLLAAGEEAEAAYWSGQAARVRAGEPLNRVVASLAGRSYELDRLDELPADLKSTKVEFAFIRNRPYLPLARALIQEGGRAGGAGEYYEALDAFRRAAKVDPFDPQPRYEQGTTLLHLERPAEAAESFAEAERLAPGWYNCRADRWLAERIAAGEVAHAVFLLLRLEDVPAGPDDLGKRLELADAALGRYPDLAPLHLFRGKALLAAGRGEEAADALRAGLACAAEPDVRTRLLVNLHLLVPEREQKRRMLREAAALAETGNLMAAAMAAVALRVLG